MAVQRRPKTGKDKNGRVRWVGRYRDAGGKEHSKTFAREKDAKVWVSEQERKVRRGTWIDPSTEKITIGDLLDRWMDRPLAPGTLRTYESTRSALKPIEHLPANMASAPDINAWYRQLVTGREWISKFDTGIAESTAREHMVRLSSAFKWAVDMEWIGKNPVKIPRGEWTRPVEKSEIPTLEQITEIIDLLETGGAQFTANVRKNGKWVPALQTARPAPVVADMVRYAHLMGERVSEIGGHVIADMNLLTQTASVNLQISADGKSRARLKTKSSKREIPIPDALVPVIDRNMAGRERGDFLFVNSLDNAWTASRSGGALRKVTAHLGYDFTFHSFRHFYISWLIAKGLPVNVVQAVAGHSSPVKTLEIYTHFWPTADEVLRAAVGCGQTSGRVPNLAAI